MGGTLIVSREVNLLPHYKKRLEIVGFRNVTYTTAEKDGLNVVINEQKPRTVIMEAEFYQSATPYMMSRLLRQFTGINFVAVSLSKYPADLAMLFIINGAKAYITIIDGIEQFYRGLECVRDGRSFVSASVQERIDIRHELPHPATEITGRQIEVLRLVCNGFSGGEIAEVLHICKRTVEFHKKEMYTALGIRNENELIRVALYLEIIKPDELNFYGGKYVISPKPKQMSNEQKREKKRGRCDY